MKAQEMYHALMKGVQTIKVRFNDAGRLYTYRCLESDNIKEGDVVIVDTPSTGPTFANVIVVNSLAVYEDEEHISYKWIVGKVEMERYKNLIASDEKFMQLVNKFDGERKRQQVKVTICENYGEEAFEQLASEINDLLK